MYMTGFADEAATDIDGQIKVTKALGWENIEARYINNKNIHDISDEEFDIVYGKLQDAGVKINCFGSAIANWQKEIYEPFDSSLEEAKRAIPRMKKLGTKLIRVMSFHAMYDKPGTKEAQMFDERVKRMKVLKQMFEDEGITMVHENCMNYGGMGWSYTLDLIEAIPGLKLVFDTGNPTFNKDYMQTDKDVKQNAWDFYIHVKDHIEYVHIKDGYYDEKANKQVFTYPNIGNGYVKDIVFDLLKSGYEGGISIEPHVQTVFHDVNEDKSVNKDEAKYQAYFHYGTIMNQMIEAINYSLGK